MLTYLPRFQTWPPWKRRLVPLGISSAFVAVFLILYPIIGGVAVILSFVPVAAISWTMGIQAGLLSGTIAVMGNYLLLTLVGGDATSVMLRGMLSSLTLVLLGGLAGWVSQLIERLRSSAHQLEQDREALRVQIVLRAQKERELAAALAEKDMLLKEVHHRVKNNLQILSSLLSLQSGTVRDAQVLERFQDSQSRIRTMALVHERLCRSDDLAQIAFDEYLRDLTSYLMANYQGQLSGVTLKVKADDIHLDIDTAIPCGLMVNELLTNALKHAFPDRQGGEIGVEVRRSGDGHYHLLVWDDGVGMPEGMDWRKTTSLGLRLVNSLTRQLSGSVEVRMTRGTVFEIRFPPGRVRER
ncbi:MAG: hypothetical protein IPK19_31340 [Chloroflexi bacterium]|nr:hypothetical protein [Chloroflexota bacterium]